MKKHIVFLFSILLLGACTTEKTPVVNHEKVEKTVTHNVKANRILSMEIEGMTCVMGCGSSIRKELFATNAVCSVEFDFVEGRKSNTAKIAFDKDKITVDKIVELISTMNEKQFTIGKTSSKEFICPSADEKCSSSSKCSSDKKCSKREEDCKIKTSASKIEIPNFLNLISRFFTN
jgi:hypothetical protein